MIDPIFVKVETVPDWKHWRIANNLPSPPSIADILKKQAREIHGWLIDYENVKTTAGYADSETGGDWWIQELAAKEAQTEKRVTVYDGVEQALDLYRDLATVVATIPETAKVAAIAYAIGEQDIKGGHTKALSERDIITAFWNRSMDTSGHPTPRQIIGYANSWFDLPVLLARSSILGIMPSRPLIDWRPWNKEILDLQIARYQYKSRGPYPSLRETAKLYGLATPILLGSEVEQAYGVEPGAIKQRAEIGLAAIRSLFAMWSGIFVEINQYDPTPITSVPGSIHQAIINYQASHK